MVRRWLAWSMKNKAGSDQMTKTLLARFVFGSVIACAGFAFLLSLAAIEADAATSMGPGSTPQSTADHNTFEKLKQKFETGPEVTRACISCHTNAAKQLHKTTHWTWDYTNPETGQRLGKRNVVNNFCISAGPNIAECSSCHIGYGWKDDSFDFASEENVDCLVCHDTTGTYSKKALREGGKRAPNLSKIARNVGRTSRATCGTCHFSGGGGKAVKHGDIDPTLAHPDFFVDVHMDADGLDFACSTCHTSEEHNVAGSRYTPMAADKHGIDVPGAMVGGRASCESCHGFTPHPEENHPKLNDHTDRVACQTCHIPRYSRGDFATKSWWDWSTAGQMKDDGTVLARLDENGLEIYNSKKGDFKWDEWSRPEFRWFDGTVRFTLYGDQIDPEQVVQINSIEGVSDDPNARIWPFKIMRGRQPYDKENKSIVAVLTTGKTGFWKTFDWPSAIEQGMERIDQPYSGEYDFVTTEMYWPISHMVAPATEALACNDCHTKDGLLKDLTGFYMPGRDSYEWLTQLGWAGTLLALIGVIIHMGLRVVLRRRNGNGK